MSNPITGPYSAPASAYHTNPGAYNRAATVSAPFIATGSYANSSAFYTSGSAAVTVTLVNGGSMTIPPIGASAPAAIYQVGVYSVEAGSVTLLYK